MDLNAMRLIEYTNFFIARMQMELQQWGWYTYAYTYKTIDTSGLLIGLNEYVYEACHEVNSSSIMKCLASSPMFTL